MKKFFPDRKHISILTYLLLFLTIACINPKPTMAECLVGICTTQGQSCSVTSQVAGGGTKNYCCRGTTAANDCAQLKAAGSLSAVNSRPIVDPTKGCSKTQINTGLGCLNVETTGFTTALLTFLAGTAGAIALMIMLIATVQIMTGGSNAEQVKKGKELFTGAITGLLFIIFSVALLKIIAGDIIKLPGF